jgi:ankyrin repeat protein
MLSNSDVAPVLACGFAEGPDSKQWSYVINFIIPELCNLGCNLPVENIISGERDVELLVGAFASNATERKLLREILEYLNNPTSLVKFDVSAADLVLTECIATSRLNLMDRILSEGYAINNRRCKIFEGTYVSPLYFAAYLNSTSVISKLIANGADPTQIEYNNDSAFSVALQRYSLDAARAMLYCRFDYSVALVTKNSDHCIPFDYIFNDSSLFELISIIGKKGISFSSLDEITRRNMEAVVIETIDSDCSDVLVGLAKIGWNVRRPLSVLDDHPTFRGYHALHYACNRHSLACISVLISLRADVNCKDSSSMYAIECCLSEDSIANRQGAVSLVENGFNVNQKLKFWGKTLLHAACTSVLWPDLFSLCVQKDADPSIPCDDGTLVICALAQDGKDAQLEELLKAQRELKRPVERYVNEKQRANGLWPLMLAVVNRHYRVASLLLSYGADPNLVCEDDGRACLHVAALYGDTASCKLLLDAGADISKRSKDKLPTALDFAINQNHRETVLFLLLSGADPYAKVTLDDPDSATSLMYAPEDLKQSVHDAMQAWETFSRLSIANSLVAAGASRPGSRDTSPAASPRMERLDSGQLDMGSVESVDSWDNTPTPQFRKMLDSDFATFQQLQAVRVPSVSADESIREDIINFLRTIRGDGTKTEAERCLSPGSVGSDASVPQKCILCSVDKLNSIIIHRSAGSSSHICCCYNCGKALLQRSQGCPLCGEAIKSVLEHVPIRDTVKGKFYVEKKRHLEQVGRRPKTPQKESRPLTPDLKLGLGPAGPAAGGSERAAGVSGSNQGKARRGDSGSLPTIKRVTSDELLIVLKPAVGDSPKTGSSQAEKQQARTVAADNRANSDEVVPIRSPMSSRRMPSLDLSPQTTGRKSASAEKRWSEYMSAGADDQLDEDDDLSPRSHEEVFISKVKTPQLTSMRTPTGHSAASSPSDAPSGSHAGSPDRLFVKVRSLEALPSPLSSHGGKVEKSPASAGQANGGSADKKKKKKKSKGVTEDERIRRVQNWESRHNKPSPLPNSGSRSSLRPGADNDSSSVERPDSAGHRNRHLSNDGEISSIESSPLSRSVVEGGPVTSPSSPNKVDDATVGTSRVNDEMIAESSNQNDGLLKQILKFLYSALNLIAVLVVYSLYSLLSPMYTLFSGIFLFTIACANTDPSPEYSQIDQSQSKYSCGFILCWIIAGTIGIVFYALSFLVYSFMLPTIFILSILRPQDFLHKYQSKKFVQLNAATAPNSKGQGLSDIDLEIGQLEEDYNSYDQGDLQTPGTTHQRSEYDKVML